MYIRSTKRAIAGATALVMTALTVQAFPPSYAYAAETLTGTTSDGFNYSIDTETGEATITGFTEDQHTITSAVLPDTVEGYTVTALGPWLFQDCPELTSVTLPSGLKKMGKRIFAGSPKLTTVTLPKSLALDGTETVYSIMDGVQGALSLSYIETVILEDGIEYVPNCLCYGMEHLKTVVIPDSVTKIGNNAFEGCTAIETIDLPDGITEIDEKAFYGTTSLTYMTMPASLETLGRSAFSHSGISSVELNEGLTTIGEYAFYVTENLKEVTVPSTVAEAGGAFRESSVETVTFADGMEVIPYKICFDADHLSTVNIPRSVTDLGEYSFAGTDGLTDFTLPKQITKANYSFSEGGPVTVHFEEGLEVIPEKTFADAHNIKNIDWADSVTTVSEAAFYGAGLEEVAIPDNVKYIGQQAFSSCEDLTELTLPTDGCEMGWATFEKTTSLKSVYVPDGLYGEDFKYTFQSSGLESITFAPTITEIPEGICCYCESLAEINWSDALETIGLRAFQECTSLKDAKLPDYITKISYAAFYGSGLETLHIPESLVTLEEAAFAKTKSLQYLYMPFDIEDSVPAFAGSGIQTLEFADGIEYIRNTCQSLPELTRVIFPESVKTIGPKAFYDDTALPEVQLPSGLETIGGDAFFNCTSLTEVTIPKSVTSTGWGPFGLSGLTDIWFEDGTEKILENICYNCQYLVTAHIPESVTVIGDGAFSGCLNIQELDMEQEEIQFYHASFYNCDSLYDERVSVYSPSDTYITRLESSQGEGGLTNYTLYYKVNPRFEDILKEGYVNVWTSDSNRIVKQSLPEELRRTDDYETQNDLRLDFTPSGKEGVLRFSTRPSANADMKVTTDFAIAMDNGYDSSYYIKHIIADGGEHSKVSLITPPNAPTSGGTAQFSVYGYAPAGEEVTVYVNGTETATASASRYTGRYTAEISAEAADGDELKVYVKSGSGSSSEQTVTALKDCIIPEKVVLRHDNGAGARSIDITNAFTEGVKPYITINPKYPLAFDVTLSTNDCARAYVASTTNGSTSYIELFFNEDTGVWSGSGHFDTRIPGDLEILTAHKIPEKTIIAGTDSNGHFTLTTEDDKELFGRELSEEEQEAFGAFLEDYPPEILVNTEQALAVKFVQQNGPVVIPGTPPRNEVIAYKPSKKASASEDLPSINYVAATFDELVLDGMAYTADDLISSEGLFEKLPVTIQEADGTHSEIYVMVLTANEKELADQVAESIPLSAPGVSYLPGNPTGNVKNSSPQTAGKFLDSNGAKNKEGIVTVKKNVETGESGLGAALYSAAPDLVKGQLTDATSSTLFEVCIKDAADKTKAGAAGLAVSTVKSAVDLYGYTYKYGDMIDQINYTKNPEVKAQSLKLKTCVYSNYLSRWGVAVGTAVAGGALLLIGPSLGVSLVVGGLISLTAWGFTALLDYSDSYLMSKIYARSNKAKINSLVDPSGIAYEFLPSNPVEGATAEIYYQDESGNAVLWNAEDYDQVNPQITDASGWFAWDVPEGMWQVRLSCDGYDDAQSEWLPVLPVQTDVNINMYSKLPAEIKDAGYSGNTAVVKFSKHMLDESVTADSLYLTDSAGSIIPCEVKAIKEEGNSTEASITFTLTAESGTDLSSAQINVTSDALSYAGTATAAQTSELRKLDDSELPESHDAGDASDLGDINGDGLIDSVDASMILVHNAGMNSGEKYLTDEQLQRADINGDGLIDSVDAALILVYNANLDPANPVSIKEMFENTEAA